MTCGIIFGYAADGRIPAVSGGTAVLVLFSLVSVQADTRS